LNARELEVANLMAAGFQDREIAARLGISLRAVKDRKSRAARRMGYKGKRLDVFLVRTVCGNVVSQSRLGMFGTKIRRIAALAVQGMTNPEIAVSLGLTEYTVHNYVREIFDRAGVWNRRELAGWLLGATPGTGEVGPAIEAKSKSADRRPCESAAVPPGRTRSSNCPSPEALG
jgi:DNA-binding NarL/FixJ family response regulator